MSTHTIYVQRIQLKSRLPEALYNESKQALGGGLDTNTNDILRGFTSEEEARWLPAIVGLPASAPDFYEKVREFWNDLSMAVPSGRGTINGTVQGLALEIGVDNNGNPYNIKQYALYRRALKHSKVLRSLDEIDQKPDAMFIIVDPSKEKNAAVEQLQLREKAATLYLLNKSHINRLKLVARLMGIDTRYKDDNDVLLLIDDFTRSRPKEFIELMENPEIEQRVFLLDLTRAGVLSLVGDQYVDGSTVLGREREALLFLKNPENSAYVVTLTARLEQTPSEKTLKSGLPEAERKVHLSDDLPRTLPEDAFPSV